MTELFHIRNINPSLLASERNRVLQLLKGLTPAGAAMEVGSTAVTGVIGKQDLDFMVRVDKDAFIEVRQTLDKQLERNPDQLSNDEYQGYYVVSPLDVAIQLTVTGSQYDNFEQFLEALRTDPHLVETYNDLKQKWDGKPMDEYRHAKASFIESVLAGESQ